MSGVEGVCCCSLPDFSRVVYRSALRAGGERRAGVRRGSVPQQRQLQRARARRTLRLRLFARYAAVNPPS